MYDESKKIVNEKDEGEKAESERTESERAEDRKDESKEEMEAAREHMLLCLEQMSRRGVELFVDGQAVLPVEAVLKAVREDSPYMADYVIDASGLIEQVRFDKVTRW